MEELWASRPRPHGREETVATSDSRRRHLPALDRRAFLRTLAVGGAGLLAGCQGAPTPRPAGAPTVGPGGAPSTASAPADWDALVAAAKQEGQLVLHGPPNPDTRQMVPEAFTRRFGIPVEYNAVRTNELAAKMVAEKQAGLVTVDVMMIGLGTFADVLYPNGMLADVRSALILPEVTDPTVWLMEPADLFLDPEHTRLMRLFYTATCPLAINRDYADPALIKSAQDLLRPELKGKLSAEDPTVSGSGANTATHLYLLFGEDFVRRLYLDQAVTTRDYRQRADWLVRGTQPIALFMNAPDIDRAQKDGFPVDVVRTLPDLPGTTSSTFGVVGLIDGGPHANAARVFVNWIASREGLEVFSRAERVPGTRKDLDYAQWVPEYTIPLPGVNYLDTYTWDFKANTQPAAAAKVKEILAGR